MNDKVICLVHACDKNEWCWDQWYKRHRKYWDPSAIKTIFLSEELSPDFGEIDVVRTGKIGWSPSLINYLKSIDVPYIIYMHEDYYLTDYTNHVLLDKLVDIVESHDMNLLKCCGRTVGGGDALLTKTDIYVDDEMIYEYNSRNQYIISQQPSIWKREFLLDTLRPDENNWHHEIVGTNRLRNKKGNKVYVFIGKKDFPYTDPIPYVEVVGHGRLRPKWKHFFEEKVE